MILLLSLPLFLIQAWNPSEKCVEEDNDVVVVVCVSNNVVKRNPFELHSFRCLDLGKQFSSYERTNWSNFHQSTWLSTIYTSFLDGLLRGLFLIRIVGFERWQTWLITLSFEMASKGKELENIAAITWIHVCWLWMFVNRWGWAWSGRKRRPIIPPRATSGTWLDFCTGHEMISVRNKW